MSNVCFTVYVGVGIVVFSEFLMLICWISGWRKISRLSERPEFDGYIIRNATIDVGGATYGYIVIASVSPKGIACKLPALFSLWHKPMFLPWKAMTSSRVGRWWLDSVIILEFEMQKTKICLRIPRQYEEIVAGAKGSVLVS
jgi:hypothetical protein